MRITGGTHRSRKLEAPDNDAVRPTSDKVRQAVFNMLNSRGMVQDAVVIDAFCGTGALGLEALSQGAAFCTFFDNNKNSINLCKVNIQSLKEEERSQTWICDATKPKERPEGIAPAMLVFFDPPYHKDLIPQAVDGLNRSGWLESECFFVMEMDKHEKVNSTLLEVTDEKIYGDTKILLGELSS